MTGKNKAGFSAADHLIASLPFGLDPKEETDSEILVSSINYTSTLSAGLNQG